MILITPYSKLYLSKIIKNMNSKVFNLMSSYDKYRCEFKELINKGRRDDGFSTCECKYDKSCDVGE